MSFLLVLQGLEHSGDHLGFEVACQPGLEEACMHPRPLPRPVPPPQRGVHGLPSLHHAHTLRVGQKGWGVRRLGEVWRGPWGVGGGGWGGGGGGVGERGKWAWEGGGVGGRWAKRGQKGD